MRFSKPVSNGVFIFVVAMTVSISIGFLLFHLSFVAQDRLHELKDHEDDRWKDDYEVSRVLRRDFRIRKKKEEAEEEEDPAELAARTVEAVFLEM